MKKITSKLLKTMVGKELWTIPNGNAVRRSMSLNEQISGAMIVKVGSQKVSVVGHGTFYINGQLDNNNFGYLPFLTKQDALDYLEAKDLAQRLRYDTDFSGLSLEQLKMIEQMIRGSK